MLSKEANERLTRVGPGSAMGELLRRYWHPLATLSELMDEPVLAVKLLGEELALYRTDSGKLGLVAQRCPHRGASLAYGIPEEEGLRCPYHGWRFDEAGHCNEQPAEPADSTFKHRIQVPAYPVQELGGLIWAYLGPQPVPLLPKWDLLVRPDLHREVGLTRLPANWLQIMENSLDPVHFEHLHAVYGNYVLKKQGKPQAMKPRKHVKIDFETFEYGILKRRLLEGQTVEDDDWKHGHPVLFPNILAVNSGPYLMLQIRSPMDDENTLVFWYHTRALRPDDVPGELVRTWDNPYRNADGSLKTDSTNGQDMMTWVTQGRISDRTTERLGNSDKGIILYRQLLEENAQRVERGEDPLNVIRDSARNEPWIEIPREGAALSIFDVRYELMYTQRPEMARAVEMESSNV